ncbi:hypothetical protein QUF79_13100 [Fictibacillus enclensis]|uniref:hypothetical protein n=1 Tax=Fictibacillus enclensis TaxID=1017270 RepID=UPI0025A2F927|nr:hypothetical protein [Fictibacillus enclensis]MDM5198961.1 hypothetical protein [Fictibacillus enclensis]
MNNKNLESAKRLLQTEKEKSERFFSEPITPFFDYKAALRELRSREEKKETKTNVDDILGELGLV